MLDSLDVLHGGDIEIREERLTSVKNPGFILGVTASGTYTERGARNFIAMADMVRAMS